MTVFSASNAQTGLIPAFPLAPNDLELTRLAQAVGEGEWSQKAWEDFQRAQKLSAKNSGMR